MRDRIGHLLPPGLQLDAGIGLFHVHAHKDECFFRYAPSFIPGAGVVAGEILESLWSSLNAVSPTARTATLAHRAEMLDDHACDSNHKKTLGIIFSLSKAYRTAIDMLEHAQTYHDKLSLEAGVHAVAKWRHDIEEAEERRCEDITAMDVYAAKLVATRPSASAVPSGNTAARSLDWMNLSLAVEEKQLVDFFLTVLSNTKPILRIEMQAKGRQQRHHPGSVDVDSIERDRGSLMALWLELRRAQKEAGIIETNDPLVLEDENLQGWDEIIDVFPNGPGVFVPTLESAPASAQYRRIVGPPPIDELPIPLPSNGNVSMIYRDLELSHRILRADHHLVRIRDLIAEKSFQFSHIIRVSPRNSVTSRSRASVKKLNTEIALHCRLYARCRA